MRRSGPALEQARPSHTVPLADAAPSEGPRRPVQKVLITGIASALGRLLAQRLRRSNVVCGVDSRRWPSAPPGVSVHLADPRKRRFEDVIRTEQPDAIVHTGFIRKPVGEERRRHDINVRGTKQLLDHCAHYGVQKLVLVSSGYVYGAFAEKLRRRNGGSAKLPARDARQALEHHSGIGYPEPRTAEVPPS